MCGDLDAAEDELSALDERVRVPAFADAPERAARLHARARRASSASAIGEVAGCVTLRFSAEPGTSFGPEADRLDRRCLVGDAGSGLRAARRASTPSRNICGVCACQTSLARRASRRRDRHRRRFKRVGDRQREQAADRVAAGRRRQRVDPLGAHEAARRVVHEHPVVGRRAPGRPARQAGGDGRGARRAAAARERDARVRRAVDRQASKCASSGATHDQDRGSAAAHRASAASVCARAAGRRPRRIAWATVGAGASAAAGARHEREQAAAGAGEVGHRAACDRGGLEG